MSRQTQLSRDGCVRFLADRYRRREKSLSRKTFRYTGREVLEARPDRERRALSKAAKTLVAEDTHTGLLNNWQSLERQGHMSRSMDQECASVWSAVVMSK